MGTYEGKVALVTGAASGIGAAAAQRFAEEGAAVVAADRSTAGVAAVVDRIISVGGRARAVTADVTRVADNAAMVAAACDGFGRLDAAFLNAGVYVEAGFEEHDDATFDRMIEINLKGVWLGLKAVLPALERGGAAVVTASASGVTGLRVAAAYSAAKHGVIGLVRSSSQSFAARGVRVNAICPGPVATAIFDVHGIPEMVPPDQLGPVPYAGTLLPQHVAEIALFLAGRGGGGINGEMIIADAGYLASYPPAQG